MYIYIHIPFCNNICSYCDFCKFLYDKKYINSYLDNLEKEIRSRYRGELVKSIYIGGGTPTSLSYDELKRLFEIVKIFKRDRDIEFTIETNPNTLDIDKIKLLRKNGINRVSIGVESFDSDTLKILNRNHSKDDVVFLVNNLKKYDISNINIDYIYGIDDNIEKVKRDMDIFLSLDIPHISAYSLIIEDNTIFKINNREYIDSMLEYEMYNYINNILRENGYKHYEISNYARDGYESIHNINYWKNLDYYGFGVSAVSFLNNERIANTKNLSKYLRGIYEDSSNYEDRDMQVSNSLILGFRMIEGINVNDFKKRFDIDIIDTYNISKLVDDGILLIDNNNIKVDYKYIYNLNEILINFL